MMKFLKSIVYLALGLIFQLIAFSQATVDGTSRAPEPQTNDNITVHVQTPDGKPLSGMTVVFASYRTNNGPYEGFATLRGAIIQKGFKQVVTGADGDFTLPAKAPPFVLATASESGFALAESKDLERKPVMIVHPWGRIEGVSLKQNNAVAGAHIMRNPSASGFYPGTVDAVDMGAETVTDAQGRFTFDHVPPLDLNVGEEFGLERRGLVAAFVAVESGGTNHVVLNAKGRTVTGQFIIPQDEDGWVSFAGIDMDLILDVPESNQSPPRPPPELDSAEARLKWHRALYEDSEAGRKILLGRALRRDIEVHDDGSFSGIFVEPGKYRLFGRRIQNGIKVLDFDLPVEVPEVGAETGNKPVELGLITLHPRNNLQPGLAAPDFSFTTLDGLPRKLSDFRGKYVLLDFWATWCAPCIHEIPNLKATFDEFGGGKRFAIISLSMDKNVEAPKKFAVGRDMPWIEAFIGDAFDSEAAKNYPLYSIPKLFLVGPDGKLVACYLRGPDIKQAVAKALAR